ASFRVSGRLQEVYPRPVGHLPARPRWLSAAGARVATVEQPVDPPADPVDSGGQPRPAPRWGAVQTRGGGDLRSYEVMFIVPPEADESVIGGVIDRITKIVSQAGGDGGKGDRWGRRRLAYESGRQGGGYYVVG